MPNLLHFSFFNIIEGCCRLWSELEQRIATLEFDRDRKSMGVMVDSSSGKKLLLVKVCFFFIVDHMLPPEVEPGKSSDFCFGSCMLLVEKTTVPSFSAPKRPILKLCRVP